MAWIGPIVDVQRVGGQVAPAIDERADHPRGRWCLRRQRRAKVWWRNHAAKERVAGPDKQSTPLTSPWVVGSNCLAWVRWCMPVLPCVAWPDCLIGICACLLGLGHRVAWPLLVRMTARRLDPSMLLPRHSSLSTLPAQQKDKTKRWGFVYFTLDTSWLRQANKPEWLILLGSGLAS